MRPGKGWTAMLEVKYREEAAQEQEKSIEERKEEEEFDIPKNVKQIGEAEKERKLYIEDYVITYLQQLTKNAEKTKAAVFLGEKKIQKECHYLFISGILEAEDVQLSQEQQEKTAQEKQKYFPDLELMGWMVAAPDQKLELTVEMEQRHRSLFPDEDTMLLIRDSTEQEEILFLMEQNRLREQRGYYVYYEQNPGMQEYLMEHKKTESVEEETQEEKAVQSFRKKLKRRQRTKSERTAKWVYGASTMLALTILVIGVTIINNYDKMKNVERALNHISKQVADVPEEEGAPVSAQAQQEETKARETEAQTQEPQTEKQLQSHTEAQTHKEEEQQAQAQTTQQQETQEQKETSQTDSRQEEQNQTEESAQTEETREVSARPSQAVYIVKNGDTLADICQRYYGNLDKVEEICELNQIENQNEIWAGEKILLP